MSSFASGGGAAVAAKKKKDLVSVGGGKRMTLQEVTKVALQDSVVDPDASTVDKMNESMAAVIRASPVVYTSDSSCDDRLEFYYPPELCRSALFYRIIFLMQGKSAVRGDIVLYLASFLNSGIIPCFSSDDKAGKELVEALCGKGYSYFNGAIVPTQEAISATSIEVLPALYACESISLSQSKFLFSSTMFVVVSGLSSVNSILDCVSGLSCESIGFLPESFDPSHYEMNRQHRGLISSANNLKMLLDGSKRKLATSSACVQAIPQINGVVNENILILAKSFEIELNSAESAPATDSKGVAFEPYPAKFAAGTTVNFMKTLVESSKERMRAITSNDANFDSLALSSSALRDSAISAYFSLLQLVDVLRMELFTSVNHLNSLDSASSGDDKEDKEDAAAAKAAAAKKPEVDDSKLTPEQLAKTLEKRRLKAEKDAAKAAAKAARKSGLVIGVGTATVRTFVNSACNVSSANPLSIESVRSMLNVFDRNESSFVEFCSSYIMQLNYGGKRKPKIPKGTKDYGPEAMKTREEAFNAIRRVFKRHGGVEIDTPVFELKEILMGKYGEDSKLIYDLADQGGELLSLRYDLTVPFARFLAMNSVGNIKRYHIAKVYRRDQPQLNRGRYREFYQCDFDIAGTYSLMVPDAEVITVACEILADLPIGNFLFKLNHRKILDAVFEISGVPAEKFRPICSAVDKLDKVSWEDVKKEMVEEKGLDSAVADKIGTFVLHSGKPKELLNKLFSEKVFGDHEGANSALKELQILFDYLDAMGSLQYISFDLSLARGLDYYTGAIYEAVLLDGVNQVGSIAAGGRYDNLVGMFSTSGTQTPCVGVSIGIERVFTIMERRIEEMKVGQASTIDVYVASIGPDLMTERMKIAQLLWKANISAEYSHLDNPKLKKQLDDVLERAIPFMVVFGSEEIAKGVVKVKNIAQHTETEVPFAEIVNELKRQGCTIITTGSNVLIEALKAGK